MRAMSSGAPLGAALLFLAAAQVAPRGTTHASRNASARLISCSRCWRFASHSTAASTRQRWGPRLLLLLLVVAWPLRWSFIARSSLTSTVFFRAHSRSILHGDALRVHLRTVRPANCSLKLHGSALTGKTERRQIVRQLLGRWRQAVKCSRKDHEGAVPLRDSKRSVSNLPKKATSSCSFCCPTDVMACRPRLPWEKWRKKGKLATGLER